MSEEERTQPAADNNGKGPKPQEQVLAVIVGKPMPNQEGLRFELRLGPGVTGPVDFCLLIADLAVRNAQSFRQKEQQQSQLIQVPPMNLPPGFDPRGGVARPPSRGKGRRRP